MALASALPPDRGGFHCVHENVRVRVGRSFDVRSAPQTGPANVRGGQFPPPFLEFYLRLNRRL